MRRDLYEIPILIKVYEALTVVINQKKRLNSIDGNLFHLYSSSGNKFYYVYLEEREGKLIAFSNDNATYYKNYFGYPIIALMFIKNILKLDEELAKELEGIHWKDLNQNYKIGKYEYDFDAVVRDLNKKLSKELIEYIKDLFEQIKKMKVYKLTDAELDNKAIPKEPPKAY